MPVLSDAKKSVSLHPYSRSKATSIHDGFGNKGFPDDDNVCIQIEADYLFQYCISASLFESAESRTGFQNCVGIFLDSFYNLMPH